MIAGIEQKLDANESAFQARQLEYIRPIVQRIKYSQLKARMHFMLDFQGGAGVETITTRFYDRVGQAQIGLEFPRVDISSQERTTPIKSLSDSYGWNFQELRNAMFAGVNISTEKGLAARRAIAEKENSIAYLGDSDSGLFGAFTHPNIPIVVGAHTIDSNSTEDQIVDMISEFIDFLFDNSLGIMSCDTILFTRKAYSHIRRRAYGDDKNKTIWTFLNETFPEVTFDWVNEASGIGTGGKDICYAYRREEVKMLIPHDFEQLPPDIKSTETVINCHERFGGIEMNYTAAAILEYTAAA